MATISSLGVGSGLDSEGIISALLAVERKPITLLSQQTSAVKTQLSSLGQLQSYTSAMRDKAAALGSTTLWGKTTFASADATTVSGSTGTGAVAGRYSVLVQKLAASQTNTSAALTNADSTLSEGSLTIELGTWTAGSFTAKSGASPVAITIGAGETSLASIRDKINAADAGVTATIINDANGARLSLQSAETGAENGFRITAAETTDDGNAATGLSALGYTGAGSPLALNQSAADAEATVNNIAIRSSSNTLTDVVGGLTLTLNKVNASPVEVTVAEDTTAITTAVNEFVTAFNALASYIREQTKYDPDAKTGGVLQGNRTVVGLQSQLRGVINEGSSASAEWSMLSEVGITMKADGTLGVTTSDLEEALKNPDELRKFFSADAATSGASGFMDRFKDLGNEVLSSEGSLTTLEASLNARVTRNTDRQEDMEDRLSRTETRLRAQYEALDTNMAKLSALSAYVTQQMSMLNSSS